jgi:enamine deaminase RidA (YjgF/YER057c/UK114 family)
MPQNNAARTAEFINPAGLYDPSANGYSHIAALAPGARLVAIAGQGGETADGVHSPEFRDQVRQALATLDTAVRAVGATLQDVVKQTVLIVDHDEARLAILVEELDRAYGRGPKPACTLIPVPRLALDPMLFEVEAWVALR